MINRLVFFIIFLITSACSEDINYNAEETESSNNLDQAAIDAGILPDTDNIKLQGHFETRNDIGTDKFCAISDGINRYKIGVLAVFGSESNCEGRGSALLDGEKVAIILDETVENKSKDLKCKFTAYYDGITLQFPGDIPESCAKFCNNRANLNGTVYHLTQEGDQQALQTQGQKLKPLCQG